MPISDIPVLFFDDHVTNPGEPDGIEVYRNLRVHRRCWCGTPCDGDAIDCSTRCRDERIGAPPLDRPASVLDEGWPPDGHSYRLDPDASSIRDFVATLDAWRGAPVPERRALTDFELGERIDQEPTGDESTWG